MIGKIPLYTSLAIIFLKKSLGIFVVNDLLPRVCLLIKRAPSSSALFLIMYMGDLNIPAEKKWSCVYLAPYCEKLRIFERREACHAEQRALTFEISHRREETEGKGRPWDCLRLMFRTAG